MSNNNLLDLFKDDPDACRRLDAFLSRQKETKAFVAKLNEDIERAHHEFVHPNGENCPDGCGGF